MNINATLFGQMITFVIFVWFTYKYVWPPLTKAMDERQQTIADGLAAAERGVRELEEAQHKVEKTLQDAKIQAAELVEEANQRSVAILEEARDKARQEGARIVELAKSEIEQQTEMAKQRLREDVAKLAILGAEKLLRSKIDRDANDGLLNQLIEEI